MSTATRATGSTSAGWRLPFLVVRFPRRATLSSAGGFRGAGVVRSGRSPIPGSTPVSTPSLTTPSYQTAEPPVHDLRSRRAPHSPPDVPGQAMRPTQPPRLRRNRNGTRGGRGGSRTGTQPERNAGTEPQPKQNATQEPNRSGGLGGAEVGMEGGAEVGTP